jgi:hypothetical protein
MPPAQKPDTINRIIAMTASRHGVVLGRSDPVLMVGTVAEVMMEEASAHLAMTVRDATDQISASAGQQMVAAKETAEHLVTSTGEWLAQQVREIFAQERQILIAAFEAQTVRNEAAAQTVRKWSLGLMVAAAATLIAGGSFYAGAFF